MQIAQSVVEHIAQPVRMQGAYSSFVEELEKTLAPPRPYRLNRRANLLALVKAKGATELATLLGTPKTHISAMTRDGSAARNIGDELATRAEDVLKLPAGWMDESHGSGGTKLALSPPTVGAIALKLSLALQSLDASSRDSAADLIARMLKNGPDERAAAALDVLAPVRIPFADLDEGRASGGNPAGVTDSNPLKRGNGERPEVRGEAGTRGTQWRQIQAGVKFDPTTDLENNSVSQDQAGQETADK